MVEEPAGEEKGPALADRPRRDPVAASFQESVNRALKRAAPVCFDLNLENRVYPAQYQSEFDAAAWQDGGKCELAPYGLGKKFDYVANLTNKDNDTYLTPEIRYIRYREEILAYYVDTLPEYGGRRLPDA